MGGLTQSLVITKTNFVSILLLFAPSFAWFYAINIHIYQYVGTPLDWVFIGEALFLLSIIISALIGSLISERIEQKRFLGLWILFGIFVTLIFAFFEGSSLFWLLSILAGTSFGIGFPSCLAYIAESTAIEERARVSGTTLLVTFVTLIFIISITAELPLFQALVVLAIFRATSFIALQINPPKRVQVKRTTWKKVWSTNGYRCYFLSWLIFMVVGGISAFVGDWLEPSETKTAVENLGLLFTYIGTGFGALFSGFASDRYGRRKIIIFGLISLALSYAIYGVTQHEISYLITQIFFGASWGIIFANYFMTVNADLASTRSKERYYALASLFLLLSMVLQLFSQIYKFTISSNVVSSLLSALLFIAVIPLLYAPETLPMDKIQKRGIQDHLKKIGKLVEKEKTN